MKRDEQMTMDTESTDGKMAKDDDDDTCFNIFACLVVFGINIAMLAVGSQYRDMCNIEKVPQFLQIGGGIMLGLSILLVVCAVCTDTDWETDKVSGWDNAWLIVG